MGKLVKPRVFLVQYPQADDDAVRAYLEHTGQTAFWPEWEAAAAAGVPSGMRICSLLSKLCYKAIVPDGRNANVTKVRSIEDNLAGTLDSTHLSVFEHANFTFLVTDCSRIYTHEQVRHRTAPPPGVENAVDGDFPEAGVAYSQTSGRYCRLDSIDLVWDPVLDPVKDLWLDELSRIEDLVYLTECKLGLRKPNATRPEDPPERYLAVRDVYDAATAAEHRWVPDMTFNFEKRKKITSAIRRIAPNGQANEIGLTLNVRTLRHVVQLRTAKFAEAEIREIYSQIYHLTAAYFPGLYHGCRTRVVDGLVEVYGGRSNPYDVQLGDPKALADWDLADLHAEIERRNANTPTA